MKQKQYAPLSIAEMGVLLYAGNEGHLQDVDAVSYTHLTLPTNREV